MIMWKKSKNVRTKFPLQSTNDENQFINRKNNVFDKKKEISRTPSNFTRLNVKNILRPMYI